MKKLFFLLMMVSGAAAIAAPGGVSCDITCMGAATTITVNALEIRSTTAKALKVWKATRKATVKAAKKVAGKK